VRWRYATIALAFGCTVAVGVAYGWTSFGRFQSNSSAMWQVLRTHADAVISVARLQEASERTDLLVREYLLGGGESLLTEASQADQQFDVHEQSLERLLDDPQARTLLTQIRMAKAKQRHLSTLLSGRPVTIARGALIAAGETQARDRQREIGVLLDQLARHERQLLLTAKDDALVQTFRARRELAAFALAALLVTVLSTAVLLRTLAHLRRSRQELERVNRELDDFSGRVAHDLRNLLTPVGLAANALDRGAGQEPMVRDIAGRLQRLTRRSNVLIEQLLTFARAGQAAEASAAASVGRAVADALEDLEPNVRAMGARVEVQVPDEQVACAPGLLHTVLINLVGNAVKFLEGSQKRVIRITARRVDRDCEIAIEDTGPGIPKTSMARLFTPFFRVPGTRAPGTGIGLATVSRILSAHHGSISVESIESQGSIFRVRLPLVPVAAHAAAV
jgi:signal transduction histidine kinase